MDPIDSSDSEVMSEITTDEEEQWDEENEDIIRAKWIFDGAKTLDEVIDRLKDQIEVIKKLKEDGWELIDEVADDYGIIRKKSE